MPEGSETGSVLKTNNTLIIETEDLKKFCGSVDETRNPQF
jgi:hypothetical protein